MVTTIQKAATIERVQSSLSGPQLPFTLGKQHAVYRLLIQHSYLIYDIIQLLCCISLVLLWTSSLGAPAVLPHASSLL